ncbi:nitrogen fixation protein NifQ [Caballeronia sp. ATUFL_M2_KS44]|uniref:nitrogen fixation protein NifQ n=1 Tax=Caballeronia sp. ATUFL_M2_KS44 TaxID=2921767 RepID=UPI0020285485|nr:nitrogen fixation protein NifQ [Caballeronia sp. ATUFL_M2_KS44]
MNMSQEEGAARRLIACARDANDPDAITFARLIGARLDADDLILLGLGAEELAALLDRHFERPHLGVRLPTALRASPHREFIGELRALLWSLDVTAAAHPADAHCLATIIATACERPDHLWRDLGLRGRDDVSAILQRHYPALVARNTNAMRWKKFLAQEVALAHGRAVTFAPGCPGCEDYAHCYPAREDG